MTMPNEAQKNTKETISRARTGRASQEGQNALKSHMDNGTMENVRDKEREYKSNMNVPVNNQQEETKERGSNEPNKRQTGNKNDRGEENDFNSEEENDLNEGSYVDEEDDDEDEKKTPKGENLSENDLNEDARGIKLTQGEEFPEPGREDDDDDDDDEDEDDDDDDDDDDEEDEEDENDETRTARNTEINDDTTSSNRPANDVELTEEEQRELKESFERTIAYEWIVKAMNRLVTN